MLGLSLIWQQDQILFPLKSAGDSDVPDISHWATKHGCVQQSVASFKNIHLKFFAVREQEINRFLKPGKIRIHYPVTCIQHVSQIAKPVIKMFLDF